MVHTAKYARVIRPNDFTELVGRQGQHIIPCVTTETCGSEGISAGLVTMPPGKASKAHYHAHSEIIVVCFRGWAATLIGPQLTPHIHGPGEFVFIPDGVVHVAVNLSDTEDLLAVEMRTDPRFDDDVVLTPEYEPDVPDIVARLRREHSAGS